MFLASPVIPVPRVFSPSSLFDAPRTGHRHGGIDLMTQPNTQLRSPEKGTIDRIYVSTKGGGGSIWIDHGLIPAFADPTTDGPGHTRTKHQHIALGYHGQPLFIVAEGDHVAREQPFAIAGDSGNAGAVHDHYEVHVDGKRIDPRQVTLESSVHGAPWLEQWDFGGMLPGPYSRLCQMYLTWWGAHLIIDGIMGPKTGLALAEFQGRFGLKVDRIAGPATWAALEPSLVGL